MFTESKTAFDDLSMHWYVFDRQIDHQFFFKKGSFFGRSDNSEIIAVYLLNPIRYNILYKNY